MEDFYADAMIYKMILSLSVFCERWMCSLHLYFPFRDEESTEGPCRKYVYNLET